MESNRWIGGGARKSHKSAKMFWINCAEKEGKKICKKYKQVPKPTSIQYWREGLFYKEFHREESPKQFEYFVRFPESDGPWFEDPKADSVHHLESEKQLKKLLKHKEPTLVMFYTPWCSACKSFKPIYAEVAKLVQDENILLAAVDCEQDKTDYARHLPYNVTAYPTILYYQRGKLQFPYNHGHKKDQLLNFLDNPTEKHERTTWADKEDSKTTHLTDDTYDAFISSHQNVMIFYHALYAADLCSPMMDEWDKAAAQLAEDEDENYFLAAVDQDLFPKLKSREGVTSVPFAVYYRDGEILYTDVALEFSRNKEGILKYLKEPTKPAEKGLKWSDQTNNVHHLTAESFRKTLKPIKHSIVFFYTEWCSHCKTTKPKFSAAADSLSTDIRILFAGIDCGPDKKLCNMYDIHGYPTMLYFNYGKNEQKYIGERTQEALIAFMNDPVRGLADFQASNKVEEASVDQGWDIPGGDLVTQLTADSLQVLRKTETEYLLYIYSTKCGICNKIKQNIIGALQKCEEDEIECVVPFYAINTDFFGAEIENLGFWDKGKGVPSFHWFNGKQFEYEIDPRHQDDFVKFFKDPIPPKVKQQDPDWSMQESAADIYFLQDVGFDTFSRDQEEMFVMFYSNSCGACSRCKPFFESAAKEMIDARPELTLAAVDIAKANEIADRYGVTSYPSFFFFKNGKMKFKVNVGHSAEKFIEFCNNPVFIELPKAESGFEVASNVTILMKNAQVWLDTQPSTMLMAHTEWCGHCKKMKPDYIRAADDLYSDDASLAAIDGDRFKSFLTPFGVTGFPSLLYFENGEFKYKYEGPRTRESIVKFMREPNPNFIGSTQQKEEKSDEILRDLPDEVVILDHKNFENFVDSHSKVIVFFYAPWCGVCKASKPSYFEAAEMIADEDDETQFCIYNCDSNDPEDTLYAQQFGIEGYPTLWYFNEGEQKYKFSGYHNVDTYLRFARNPKTKGREEKVNADGTIISGWSDPSGVHNVVEVTEEDWDEVVNSKKHVFLFWYTPFCIRCLDIIKPFYIKAANDILDIRTNVLFTVIDAHDEKNMKKDFGVESFPTIQYYKNGVYQYDYLNTPSDENFVSFMKSPTPEKAARPEKWQSVFRLY